MTAAPHLRPVETGEIPDDAPSYGELADQNAGLERDLRAWRMRYAELLRDKEREALDHDLWDEAERLFKHWRMRCNHPRSKFTLERFETVLPLLKKYGTGPCMKAIEGAAYDAFETRRKNGSAKRHDDWGLVFRDADHLEDFCNRAPREAA